MEEEPLGNLTCRRDGRVLMADFCVRMYVLLALLTLSPIWLCMPSNSLVVFLFSLPRVAQDRRGCGDFDFELLQFLPGAGACDVSLVGCIAIRAPNP